MKKNMKASTTKKKIVVKCADFWMDEYEIDSEIFEDVYMESATRAVEKRKNDKGFKVAVIIECWEKKDFKKPEKHFCYNTYRVLINAALHDKAEMLRTNFKNMYGVDLQKETMKDHMENNSKSTKPSKGESKDGNAGTDK